ncbi:MAG TPA: glutamyl-tRNA reductase, partial [Vicinamibacteria bacterium]
MIAIAGLSHRTADLPLREALAFPRDGLEAALQRVRAEAGLAGAMILSTCNRVEIYAQSDAEDGAEERLVDFLCAFHGKPRAELDAHVYRLAGADAVRHAFRVAASLDSMVLGEPQILGQVKEAYRTAEAAGVLGSALIALRNRSLAAAKRARSETGIGQNAVSVSYVAVELARK